MTMYHEMTYRQRFGLTIEAAEELKEATLAELTEMGFTDIPKATSDETWDAMVEQVDEASADLQDAIWEAVMDAFPGEVCKENYQDFEERWLEMQVDRLHCTEKPKPETFTAEVFADHLSKRFNRIHNYRKTQ